MMSVCLFLQQKTVLFPLFNVSTEYTNLIKQFDMFLLDFDICDLHSYANRWPTSDNGYFPCNQAEHVGKVVRWYTLTSLRVSGRTCKLDTSLKIKNGGFVYDVIIFFKITFRNQQNFKNLYAWWKGFKGTCVFFTKQLYIKPKTDKERENENGVKRHENLWRKKSTA